MSNENHDYSTGELRRHHAFYFEEADVCLQVEKALFKVHRFLIGQRSEVLRDMFKTSQGEGNEDGTDERPLCLAGDSAAGWEALFQSIYAIGFLKTGNTFTGKAMLAVLRVAHKYCMEPIEEEILSHFKEKTDKENLLNLLICSRIVGSTPLSDQAVAGLVQYRRNITLKEARQIELEALHRIMISPGPFERAFSPDSVGEPPLGVTRVRGRSAFRGRYIHPD